MTVDSVGSREPRTVSRRTALKMGGAVVVGAVVGEALAHDQLKKIDLTSRIPKEIDDVFPEGAPNHIRENSINPNVAPAYFLDEKGNKIPFVHDVEVAFLSEKAPSIYTKPNDGAEVLDSEDLEKKGVTLSKNWVVHGEKWFGARYPTAHGGPGDVDGGGLWVRIIGNDGNPVGFMKETYASYVPGTQRSEEEIKQNSKQGSAKKDTPIF